MSKNIKKSIAVKVYFWSVEEEKGKIKKGVAWASGTIALESNTAHGIKADTKVFNSLEEMQVKLHELLKDNDVSLVMGDNADIPRLGKGYPLKGGPWSK